MDIENTLIISCLVGGVVFYIINWYLSKDNKQT